MLKGGLVLLLFYLINFSLWEVLVGKGMATPQWASFSVYFILFFVVLACYWKKLSSEWHKFREQLLSIPKFLLDLILWTIGGTGLTLLIIFIFGNILGIELLSENQENIIEVVHEIPAILSFMMIALFGPIIEELVFREGIIGWVNRTNHWLLVIMTVLSIILFDTIHVIQLTDFWYYLPMSLVLTGFYLKYERNVWSSILLHMFNNAAGVILMMFQ